MDAPWNVERMTIDEAIREYERMRGIAKPSTADLRREGALCRRIRSLANIEFVSVARSTSDLHELCEARDLRNLQLAGVGR